MKVNNGIGNIGTIETVNGLVIESKKEYPHLQVCIFLLEVENQQLDKVILTLSFCI